MQNVGFLPAFLISQKSKIFDSFPPGEAFGSAYIKNRPCNARTNKSWYHLDSQKNLPQNAITGAPGGAYLSTHRLPDHVRQRLLYPISTNRGSLNSFLCLLFCSQSLHILGIIPRIYHLCQGKYKGMTRNKYFCNTEMYRTYYMPPAGYFLATARK